MNPTRVIRGVAAFDLVVTAFLAIPALSHVFVRIVYTLEGALRGGDVLSTAPLIPPIAWLFVNIAGVLGVLWALVRIAMPLRELAIADSIARCFVAALIVYYCLAESVPSVLFAFAATEVLGSTIQLFVLRQSSARSTTLTKTI